MKLLWPVIDELKVKFLSEDKALVLNRHADNVEAYQLYLKGRYHFLKLTPAETEKGIAYFQQAIATRPELRARLRRTRRRLCNFPVDLRFAVRRIFPEGESGGAKSNRD
ncbi:MAG: hypothetical protein WKF71_11445 [Pyrinomonadaceae bacterium]